jgi:hypothetical protein
MVEEKEIEKETEKESVESTGKNLIGGSVDKATDIGEALIGKTSELLFSVFGVGYDLFKTTGMNTMIKKVFVNKGSKQLLKKLTENGEIREVIGDLIKDIVSPKKPEK